MIILTTSTESQTFVFIPRVGTIDYVGITDDQTNETVEIEDYEYTEGDYYNTIEAEFNLVENHFYDLIIKSEEKVLYRDRIFCTNQPIVQFTVNNGQYISSSTANEFIVYE